MTYNNYQINTEYKRATKATILCRVSSKEQQENHSNDAQERSCLYHCEKNNLEVLKTFRITESSTSGERRDFYETIEFALGHDEPIAIIVDTIDRFQRSYAETVDVTKHIKSGAIELHFLREGLKLDMNSSNPDNMRWDMGVLFAKSYVGQLRDNVMRGQREAVENGEFPGASPKGYRNIGDKKKAKDIILHDFEAPIVAEMFKMYATGKYSYKDLLKFGVSKGLYTSKQHRLGKSTSTIEGLLKNKFYIGIMTWGKKEMPHKYPKLIDYTTFKKCKEIREQKSRQKGVAKKNVFTFSGIVNCAETGFTLTPYQRKGKYVYHRTHQKTSPCHNMNIPEPVLMDIADELMDSITVSPECLKMLLGNIKDCHDSKVLQHKKNIANLNGQITRKRSGLEKALELSIETTNVMTGQMLTKKIDNIQFEIVELTERLGILESENIDYYRIVARFLEVVNNYKLIYDNSDSTGKNEILKMVLSNWTYDGSKFSVELHQPFKIIQQKDVSPLWCTRLDSNQ